MKWPLIVVVVLVREKRCSELMGVNYQTGFLVKSSSIQRRLGMSDVRKRSTSSAKVQSLC